MGVLVPEAPVADPALPRDPAAVETVEDAHGGPEHPSTHAEEATMKIDYTDPRNHDIDCLFAMKLGPCDSGCEPKEASPAILDQQEIDALSQRVKDLEHALGLMIHDAQALRELVDLSILRAQVGSPLDTASQRVWDTAGFCQSVLGRHNPGDDLTAPDRHDP